MINSKINRFSPSMIQLYMDCPLAFYYQYIAKIKIPQKQIHLLFGTAIHQAIEDGIYGKQDPNEVFIKTFEKKRLTDEEKNLHKEYINLGLEMVKNYVKVHPMLNKLYDLNNGESEKYIRRDLINPMNGEHSSLPMSGRLDRLTFAKNNLEGRKYSRIIEYKTSKHKWRSEDANFKIQTLLYNLWFYSEYGVLPDETIYIILLKKYKKREKDETYQILKINHTSMDLASTFEEIELILNKINNEPFNRPTTGYHPPYCSCYEYERILNINQ